MAGLNDRVQAGRLRYFISMMELMLFADFGENL
jgi:hypothetical protein